MKAVYIAHPLGRDLDREANRARASRWVGYAGTLGFAPVADWIILSGQWPEERRELGLQIDFALIERCDELWLCGGRVSPGMRLEAEHARSLKKLVLDLTPLGAEPPAERASVLFREWMPT